MTTTVTGDLAGRPTAPPRVVGRGSYLLLGVALLGAAVQMGGWSWALLLWAVAPDVPLLFGAGPGLARGQLHPRAVPAYNATHRLVGPFLLTVIGAWTTSAGHGSGPALAGLVWAGHVMIDRACGYGLRTREGFQR